MQSIPRAKRAPQSLVRGAMRAVWNIGRIERAEGTLGRTLGIIRARRNLAFARDWTFAELLEWAAERHPYRDFLEYGREKYSFNDMNRRANRVARRLRQAGIDEGVGVAIMMSNHPRFLDTFFAIQKLGAYAVPINTGLLGEGLAYVLQHSEAHAVICDHEAAPNVAAVRSQLTRVQHIWVSTVEATADDAVPEGMRDFAELERGNVADGDNLGRHPSPEAPSLLMYTSGTTGLPKAVVTSYGVQRVKPIGLLAHLAYDETDKLYSCLPLFHANALLLSVMPALWVGIPLHLSKRFSASRFWMEVAESGATQFNTVGGMIPILLKTPRSPYDSLHKVRRVISAACPKDAWLPFRERFGVAIWEAYGAVDGGGVTIVNTGNAPIGSLGKLRRGTRWKLVDEQGRDVPPGQPGELRVYVGEKRESKVQYWKDEKATSEKVIDGWIHTGDSMQADKRGFLYFVGRNTDSMRRRGENVSAYEVEKVVDAHPDVLESAAFGVPSPVGEQDIMICVVPADGHSVDPKDLLRFLKEHLPRYAVPSYVEIVSELPKTGTHRVIKNELKKRGVTKSTINLEQLSVNHPGASHAGSVRGSSRPHSHGPSR